MLKGFHFRNSQVSTNGTDRNRYRADSARLPGSARIKSESTVHAQVSAVRGDGQRLGPRCKCHSSSFASNNSNQYTQELNFQANSQSAQTSVIQSTKLYQQSPLDQNDQDFNSDNHEQNTIYGDENLEQNSFNKFKRINDYIENHYHDSNSDIDMDGNTGE